MSENTERGSFTIPKIELDKLNEFTAGFVEIKSQINRSEIIRVGIYEVIQKDKSEVKRILEDNLIRLKSGKPRKEISSTQKNVSYLTISDKQWREIAKLLQISHSKTREGRPKVNFRQVINGILYIFQYEKQRRDIPKHLGSFTTCWRRLNEWQNNNVWKQICNILLNSPYSDEEKCELEKVLLRTLLIATKK